MSIDFFSNENNFLIIFKVFIFIFHGSQSRKFERKIIYKNHEINKMPIFEIIQKRWSQMIFFEKFEKS